MNNTTTQTRPGPVGPQSSMREVLEAYPGAQRALFRRYHIGGCSSCGFRPTETLAEVCARNGLEDLGEVLDHIRASHEQDARLLVSPADLARQLQNGQNLKLLDVRSREEWETARIDGSLLLSNTLLQEILNSWPHDQEFVICDHRGAQALDAAAYFLGHGFTHVRCLSGGIDAWAQEVDPKLRRYQVA